MSGDAAHDAIAIPHTWSRGLIRGREFACATGVDCQTVGKSQLAPSACRWPWCTALSDAVLEALLHVWMAPLWQGFCEYRWRLVTCGHVSGLACAA